VPDAYTDANGNLHISSRKKRDILVNNIYGVDIDRQAVEVTQMSLYLKVLEGENAETLNPQMTLALKEVYLPVLSDNIKCGNSLIGTDFTAQGELFDAEQAKKINAFDWEAEFPEILSPPLLLGEGRGEVSDKSTAKGQTPPQSSLKTGGGSGGFDCVIGNPPWVFGGGLDIEQNEKGYFQTHYKSAKGKVNLFAIFLEKAASRVRQGGLVSFIVPNTLLRVTSYTHAREFLLSNYQITEIADLGTAVFVDVTMSSIIITLRALTPMKNDVVIKRGLIEEVERTPQQAFVDNDFVMNIFSSPADNKISSQLKKVSTSLGELCKELIFGVVITKNFDNLVFEKKKRDLKPFVEGRDIARYTTPTNTRFLLYDRKLLHRPRTPEVFEVPAKIMIQRITGGDRPLNATIDERQLYNKESINNIILKDKIPYSLRYVLGLLNSRLLNWHYKTTFTNASKLTVNLSKEYLSRLPIRIIDFTKPEEKKMHDDLVSLVDKMLELHKQLQKASFDSDKEPIERQIAATDKRIDALVYKLYGLTEEEIKIVERN